MLAKYETPPTWQESRSHDIRLVSVQEHLQAWLALESCKERVSGFHGIGKVKGRYAQQEREIELPRYETLRREGQLLGCSHSPPSPFLLLGFLLRAKPGRLDIADVDALQVGRQSHTIIVKISYLPPLLAFLAAIASKVVP
jgi:hypothetical protein